jgi:pyruvate,water dikinase
VPAGILVMDMGGGLKKAAGGKPTLEEVLSVPFRAVLHGMLHPGAWRAEPVSLHAGDFLSSMVRMPDITSMTGSTAGYNIAVISEDYVNMSIRFGYHFNMLDCYCSGNAKNNHIYFRFAGGATDLAKRSRRLDLLSRVLTEYGYAVKVKGDLLIARLAGLARGEMEKVLDRTGRLIAFARQLDAVLENERDVARFAEHFLNGQYELSSIR